MKAACGFAAFLPLKLTPQPPACHHPPLPVPQKPQNRYSSPVPWPMLTIRCGAKDAARMCLHCRRARSRRSAVPVAGRRSAPIRKRRPTGLPQFSCQRKWGCPVQCYEPTAGLRRLGTRRTVAAYRSRVARRQSDGRRIGSGCPASRRRGSIRRRPVRRLGMSPHRTGPANGGKRPAVAARFRACLTWFVFALGIGQFRVRRDSVGLVAGHRPPRTVERRHAGGAGRPDRLVGRLGVADRPPLARQPRGRLRSSTTLTSRSTS